jgi:dGTPase
VEKSSKVRGDIFAEGWGVPRTLEGQVVKTADAIAYVNHDIADAERAGILQESDLPDRARALLGRSHAERLNTLICDSIEASWAATGEGPPVGQPSIRFSPAIREAANELREFMFERVYFYEDTLREAERGKEIVRFLFVHFRNHPGGISAGFSVEGDPLERRAADYVSGMTDRYAIRLARELGCPAAEGWRA